MHRALYVTAETTTREDGSVLATPPGSLADLPGFLARVGGTVPGEGVVILHPDAAGRLGLGPDGAGLDPAREAGWQVTRLSDWSTFYADGRPTLRVCLTDRMVRPVQIPLWADTPGETLAGLALWHQLTGSAYHGTPGIAGLAVLSALAPRGKGSPTWKPQDRQPDGYEDDYLRTHWRAAPTGAKYAHGYDANRAYIAAAANVTVAKAKLRPGPRVFDKSLGGWWRVELAPWNEKRLPDPAGYDPDNRTVRLITTPTLQLLEELTDEGVYGGVRIVESWTAPGSQLLRPWAWRLRDAYAGKDPQGRPVLDGQPAERVDAVRATIKAAGRQTLGLFSTNQATNWIHRPDWWHSIVAMDRANRWRKMYRTARKSDRWPAWVDVDNTWYASDEPDWKKAAPPGWKIDETGVALGQFTHGGTRRSRRA